jgi:hypothetical protein
VDSNQAAAVIGTTPRILRQFLRSPSSTFVAVGSGARYEFSDRDIPTLRKRFSEWAGTGRPKPSIRKPVPQTTNGFHPATPADLQAQRDREVWAEEDIERAKRGLGPLVLPDIRDPRVLARVRAAEAERDQRLELLLMARGMHITQMGDRR